MLKTALGLLILGSLVVLPARADEDVITAVRGTVTKVNAAAKTVDEPPRARMTTGLGSNPGATRSRRWRSLRGSNNACRFK